MPDLASVAREVARAEAERRFDPLGAKSWAATNTALGFIEGFTECASRIPSEREIEIAILGRTATQAAKAVRALIERGIGA